jgi:hypothetical protein
MAVTSEDSDLYRFDAQSYRVWLIEAVDRLAEPGRTQAAW